MEKKLILSARALSIIFNPFYLPLLGIILLFLFSYLNALPWDYKLTVVGIVYLFTVLLPNLTIRLYRSYNGWKLFELGQKERRMVPYITTIVCYFACYYTMNYYRIPYFISSILVVALNVQLICAFINSWWKISTHSAGIGALTGTLIIFSFALNFYLLWWLCLALIISGLVGSSRIILRLHTLSEVLVGYGLGFVISILTILFL